MYLNSMYISVTDRYPDGLWTDPRDQCSPCMNLYAKPFKKKQCKVEKRPRWLAICKQSYAHSYLYYIKSSPSEPYTCTATVDNVTTSIFTISAHEQIRTQTNNCWLIEQKMKHLCYQEKVKLALLATRLCQGDCSKKSCPQKI